MTSMPTCEQIAKHWFKCDDPRAELFVQDMTVPACFACSKPARTKGSKRSWNGAVLERAHIVARQFGGPDTADNILLLCQPCHREQPDVPDRDAVIDWANNHRWWGSDMLRRIGEHFDTPQQMVDSLSAASGDMTRFLSMCGIHGGVGIKPATIAIAAALIASTPAKSQTQQFYGRDGDYLGTALPSGPNVRQYYDANGNHAATTMRAGRNSFVYGPDGSFVGTIMNTGPQSGDQ